MGICKLFVHKSALITKSTHNANLWTKIPQIESKRERANSNHRVYNLKACLKHFSLKTRLPASPLMWKVNEDLIVTVTVVIVTR